MMLGIIERNFKHLTAVYRLLLLFCVGIMYMILQHSCREPEVVVKCCVRNLSNLVHCKVISRCGHRGFGLRLSTPSTSTSTSWYKDDINHRYNIATVVTTHVTDWTNPNASDKTFIRSALLWDNNAVSRPSSQRLVSQTVFCGGVVTVNWVFCVARVTVEWISGACLDNGRAFDTIWTQDAVYIVVGNVGLYGVQLTFVVPVIRWAARGDLLRTFNAVV